MENGISVNTMLIRGESMQRQEAMSLVKKNLACNEHKKRGKV